MHLKLPDEADYEPMRKLTLGLVETVHPFRQERDRRIPIAPADHPPHTVQYVKVTPAAFQRYAEEKCIRLPAAMHELKRFATDFDDLDNS